MAKEKELTPAQRWAQIVEQAGNRLILIPDHLKDSVEAWSENWDEFQKELAKVAEKEIRLQIALQDIIIKVCEHTQEADPLIWKKKIVGINEDARKDGVYILNVE